MRFSKWHALGNSYLVIERADAGRILTPDDVRRLCDPDCGVGSHGVLEVVVRRGDAAEIVIWNPDGSTAGMSGNGTRIAAAWLAAAAGADVVTITVAGRSVGARVIAPGIIEQDLGEVEVGAVESLEVGSAEIRFVPVELGNPHAVVVGEQVTRERLLELGPSLETHPRFPQRTNVQLAEAVSDTVVRALVWERGAGETPASGSSAVAVAAAAASLGWSGSTTTVRMPGGDLRVTIESARARLVGPAEEIARGEIRLEGLAAREP
jgi:diaminopimelate epimerase